MGKWWRAIGAVVVLVGLVVGLPILLVEIAGWPLPSEVPDWGHVWQMLQQGDIPSEPVVKTLAVILWILWAAIVWSFAWELATTLTTTSRGDRPPRAAAPFVPPAVSLGVGRLVAAILAIGVATSSVMASSSVAATPLPTPELVADAPSLHVPRADAAAVSASPRPAAAVHRWVAGATDTVWDVASTALGDATRVEEIVAMNAGVRPARVLRPGQVLELPADAVVPADRRPAEETPAAAPVEVLPATTLTVQPGDTLWDHASGRLQLAGAETDPAAVAAYVDAVVTANPGVIVDADVIAPGDVLTMPAVVGDDPPPVAPSAGASSHRVRAGDTLWDILDAHYGTVDGDLVWRVADHNGLADPSAIDVDQLLVLPDLDTAPTAPPPVAAPEAAPPVAAEPPAPQPASPVPPPPTTPAPPPPVAPPLTPPPTTSPPTSMGEPTSAPSHPTESTVPTGSTEPPLPAPVDPSGADADSSSSPSSPVGFGEAALLSAGLLALLAARRRARLRAARPRARLPEPRPAQVATERALRAVDATERLLRVDVAVRAAAASLIDGPAQIALVRSGVDGAVELTLTAEATLPPPWTLDHGRWLLPGSTPVELLADAARTVGAPCVAFAQLGVDDHGRDVFADLEALGVLAIVADDLDHVDAVVRGLAATLATSALAEMVNLVGVGLDERTFLDHGSAHMAPTVDEAVTTATMLVGTTADARQSTFVLRARHTGGEAWEPAIVLTGAGVAAEVREEHVRAAARRRGGVAMVIGGDAPAAPWTLRAMGDRWRLEPLGITLSPVTLTVAELVEIREMLRFAEQPLIEDEPTPEELPVTVTDEVDAEVAAGHAGEDEVEVEVAATPGLHFEEAAWALLVRLLGPVEVVDRAGVPVRFERSKTLELIAWLSLHRGRSTRAAARTALWELDVRDTTFANVVSEARRAMARQVEPPEHEEWVGRTLTEELPLHALVVSDADLVRARLDHARLQPPELAIETLRPAVELIRDVPLSGTGYLWPDAEGTTSELVLLATSAATELAGHYLSIGDVDGVFWATGRGLQVLPGHEALIALRMRAHARAGDLAGVRTEWESYERVLHADPWGDCEPAPKLVVLRRELLSPMS